MKLTTAAITFGLLPSSIYCSMDKLADDVHSIVNGTEVRKENQILFNVWLPETPK